MTREVNPQVADFSTKKKPNRQGLLRVMRLPWPILRSLVTYSLSETGHADTTVTTTIDRQLGAVNRRILRLLTVTQAS
jgi:hypothetical protein